MVFHGPDLKPNLEILRKFYKYGFRPAHQKWLFFTSESPLSYNTPDLKKCNDLFNLTMTYDTRSDIVLPYGRYRHLSQTEERPERNKNYATYKTRSILWFASNCVYLRKWLARQLGTYVQLDVGGDCNKGFNNPVHCARIDGATNELECKQLFAKYKFYLAFESNFCDDYITEKYWMNAIENEVVPIVLGGANYSDPRLAIPGSYINAQEFESVEALGRYLQMLENNDDEYNKYFSWKQIYKLVKRPKWPYDSEWVCELCEKLQYPSEYKSYNLQKWWSSETKCGGYRTSVITNMFKSYLDL